MSIFGLPGMRSYQCNCGGHGKQHVHAVCSNDIAYNRGAFRDRVLTSSICEAQPDRHSTSSLLATSLTDAIAGSILGLMIGDALAAPLHWIYTWSAAASFKEAHFGGKLRGFATTPAAAQSDHPDSHKYFSRCNPAAEPFPSIFGDTAKAAAAWSTPGTPYHGTLPAGDNTLTARLVALTSKGIAEHQGFDANAYAAAYARMLLEGRASGENNDTWVDESHRVFFRNVAKGAAPAEAGLDDCCLTGLALSLPCNLAYLANRDAADLACRAQLQLTHKSEDMLAQVAMMGDLMKHMAAALAVAEQTRQGAAQPADHRDAAAATQARADIAGAVDALASLRAFARAFSNGKVELGPVQERLDSRLFKAAAAGAAPTAGDAAGAARSTPAGDAAGGTHAVTAKDGDAGTGADADEDALWQGDEVAFHGGGPTGDSPVFSLR